MKCPCCDNAEYFDRLELIGGYGDTMIEFVECQECCAVFTLSYQCNGLDRIIEEGD